MDTSLKGKHALVCGASAGIGRAAALEIAKLGATVTILARREDELKRVAKELQAAGAAKVHVVAADLEARPILKAKLDAHLAQHGPIHILVNNQGGPPSGPIIEQTEEAFLKAYGRIQLASHLLVQLLVPGMNKAGYGRIVNVLSTSVREPIVGLGIGNTIRASMAAWAKTLSKELPPGITINSVLPGATDTERLHELSTQMAARSGKPLEEVSKGWFAHAPEGRLGRPEELGAVIAFLCSPAASFVRGVALAVDGGRLNGFS